MDVTASNVPLDLKSVAASLIVEEIEPTAKKPRFAEEMNRVAEIVLVLSALGRIRGGENPTNVELELMDEARSQLVEIYQEFTPKDIIPKEDIKGLIEDLGFDGNDKSLGFQAPKKVSLGKRKMEEAEKFSTPKVLKSFRVQSPAPAKNVPLAVPHHWPQIMINGASQCTPYYYGWSVQPHSTISFSNPPNKHVPVQSSVGVADPIYRPILPKTWRGTFPGTIQPMQGVYYGQAYSFGNNHAEISKIIRSVLHRQAKQYPLWNPPSRDYMSRTMTCQMCEATVNEVETVLVCDECDKAYHLKCMDANNTSDVPKSEWLCSRCVKAFNGKPFFSHYGRVVRTTTEKMPSSTAELQSSTEKKVESVDIKVNQQKPIITTSSGAATTSASLNANTNTAPESLTEIPNPTAPASTSAVRRNDTMSSTSPTSSQVPVNATSTTTLSSPTVTENGDSCSSASGTADHSILNTDLTTQAQAFTVTSSSNCQPPETSKATEDTAIDPMNHKILLNPSESASHSDSLNDKTTSENGQDSSKDATENYASETCQNHPTESPAAVISDKDSKIAAEPSIPKENSAKQTDKTSSQPPSESSQTVMVTPNVKDSLLKAKV